MDKRKKSRNFFQGGWEIVAFSSYKHKKAVALGPFGPSGNSFFVLRGQCFGIVIVYEKSYLQIPDMPARARVRARTRGTGTGQPKSILYRSFGKGWRFICTTLPSTASSIRSAVTSPYSLMTSCSIYGINDSATNFSNASAFKLWAIEKIHTTQI